MKEITKTDNHDEDYYKWFVLASLCLNSMCNIFMFTAISPIWSMVAIYYNTTDYTLNWLSNMYYLPLITLTFLFNPFINKYFGISQILSCCFTSLGLWLLFIVKHDFTLCCLSYILIGIGESLYFNVPLHLSKIWFPNSERIVSTFIGQYASNVGMLIGYVVSTIYFFEITDETEFNYRYENLIFYNALFSTIALIFNFSTLRKPKQSLANLQIRDSFLDSYKKICLAEEALIDFLSVSAFIGLSWCYTLLFGTQQYLIGQTYIEVTQTSIIFQLGQIITGGFCTWKLQNYSKKGMQLNFDAYIKGTIAIGFWSLVFQILFFESVPISVLYLINFLIGVGLGGSYCVLLESLTEKHYPIQELTIGTGLAAGASIVSFVITMILVIPKFLEFGFQISCYLMILPFCYISVFYKTQFKRFEVEA